jgi:RNA polymerase sigma-70 factor (ECF subfamily)
MEREEDLVFARWRESQREGKQELEQELVRLLQRHAHAVCYLMLREHRPDLVNQAILQALRAEESFRGDSKFSTWFHAIVRNACLNVLKQKQARRETSLDDCPELSVENSEAQESRMDIEHLLEDLSERDKALVQYKIEGLGPSEIAVKLGIRPDDVRKRWMETKQRLVQRLQPPSTTDAPTAS